MMADRVENQDRDPIEDYISDCDDEDFLVAGNTGAGAAGPPGL